jgi:hypothetical protein
MNGKVVSGSTTITTTPMPSDSSPKAQPSAVMSSSTTKVDPTTVSSFKVGTTTTIQVAEKSEVLKLKKRIDEMTKNIDKLTEMVEKVTLHQGSECISDQIGAQPEAKRKKSQQQSELIRDDSSDAALGLTDLPMPDETFSTSLMDIDDLMSSTPPETMSSHDSQPSSDVDFVDQLFTAFHEDDDVLDWFASHSKNNEYSNAGNVSDDFLAANINQTNRPDPELMQRLSDALQLLPRDIQELIVTRLIDAITCTDEYSFSPSESPNPATFGTSNELSATNVMLPQAVTSSQCIASKLPKKTSCVANTSKSAPEQHQPIQPLAAATLAALLHHYTNQVKVVSHQQQQEQVVAAASESKKNIKSLPVIQVHA